MVYCEIINPSDAYTIHGDDLDAAKIATIILGRGMYGLQDEKGERLVPIFFGGGLDEWCLKEFGADFNGTAEKIGNERLAAAFDSVTIGSIAKNRELDDMLTHITDAGERKKFLAKRHDKMRSSLNNIGKAAKSYAKAFRDKVKS